MPQYQQIQEQPHPANQAVNNFAQGFVNRHFQNKEEDALERILSGVKEEHSDQDIMKRIFAERGLPYEKKEKLSQHISNVRKNSKDVSHLQQLRLARDSIFNQYHKKIKELDDGLKNGVYSKGERPGILELRKNLIQERDRILSTATNNEQPKPSDIFKDIEAKPTEKKPSVSSKLFGSKKKVKFSHQNPEHKKRAAEVLKSVNNDEAKAHELLMQEFEP